MKYEKVMSSASTLTLVNYTGLDLQLLDGTDVVADIPCGGFRNPITVSMGGDYKDTPVTVQSSAYDADSTKFQFAPSTFTPKGTATSGTTVIIGVIRPNSDASNANKVMEFDASTKDVLFFNCTANARPTSGRRIVATRVSADATNKMVGLVADNLESSDIKKHSDDMIDTVSAWLNDASSSISDLPIVGPLLGASFASVFILLLILIVVIVAFAFVARWGYKKYKNRSV